MWDSSQSDEPLWFEHRVWVPALTESQTTEVDLQHWQVGGDLTEADTVFLGIRLVSELGVVDEVLHNGSITAQALDDSSRFVIDNDWMLTIAFLGLDVVDEFDAPKLAVTMFLKGVVDDYQLEAHCFYNGTWFAAASDVETRYTFTASDGSVVGREIVASFDSVRGWNNLSASGWGSNWHLLDAHDGQYEVKLLRDSQAARVVAFAVEGGRIVAPGAVEFDPEFSAVMVASAAVLGDLDGAWNPWGAPAFYGAEHGAGSAGGANTATIDDVYAQRVEPTQVVGDTISPERAEAVHAFIDRSERLLATWEADFVGAAAVASATAPDYAEVLSAEAVLRERSGYDELALAIETLPDADAVSLGGGPTTLRALRDRVLALFTAAEARLSAAAGAEADELAPYRALLAGDKLAIFEQHPATEFEYVAAEGTIIRSTEELAAAEYWFFEGRTDVPSTADVDGIDIRVAVEGWRVRGWRFDSTGAALDSFESSGLGSAAPASAFTPDRPELERDL